MGKTGEELWNHPFKPAVLPGKGRYQGTFLCPNGITATPVIDKNTNLIYVLSADGALFGLDLGSGKVRYGPVQFVAAYAKAQSLSLVDGVVYTTLAQGLRERALRSLWRGCARPSPRGCATGAAVEYQYGGNLGRGGPVFGKNGVIYGGTADGHFDPIAGDYSDSVVAVSAKEMKLVDYFLPHNWDYIRRKDFDLGSATPVYFGWKNRELVAGGFKEGGVVYLMDANELGGKDHQTTLYTSPRLGNDKATGLEGLGIWGAALRPTGTPMARRGCLFRWVGRRPPARRDLPLTNGENPNGSIMAFKVAPPTPRPAWAHSGAGLDLGRFRQHAGWTCGGERCFLLRCPRVRTKYSAAATPNECRIRIPRF